MFADEGGRAGEKERRRKEREEMTDKKIDR